MASTFTLPNPNTTLNSVLNNKNSPSTVLTDPATKTTYYLVGSGSTAQWMGAPTTNTSQNAYYKALQTAYFANHPTYVMKQTGAIPTTQQAQLLAAQAAAMAPTNTAAQNQILSDAVAKLQTVSSPTALNSIVAQAKAAGVNIPNDIIMSASNQMVNNQKLAAAQTAAAQTPAPTAPITAAQKAALATQLQGKLPGATTQAALDAILKQAADAGVTLNAGLVSRQNTIVQQQASVAQQQAAAAAAAQQAAAKTAADRAALSNTLTNQLAGVTTQAQLDALQTQAQQAGITLPETGITRATTVIQQAQAAQAAQASAAQAAQQQQAAAAAAKQAAAVAAAQKQAEVTAASQKVQDTLPQPGSAEFGYAAANNFPVRAPDGTEYYARPQNLATGEPGGWFRSTDSGQSFQSLSGGAVVPARDFNAANQAIAQANTAYKQQQTQAAQTAADAQRIYVDPKSYQDISALTPEVIQTYGITPATVDGRSVVQTVNPNAAGYLDPAALNRYQDISQKQIATKQAEVDFSRNLPAISTVGQLGQHVTGPSGVDYYAVPADPLTGQPGGWYQGQQTDTANRGSYEQFVPVGDAAAKPLAAQDFQALQTSSTNNIELYQRQQAEAAAAKQMADRNARVSEQNISRFANIGGPYSDAINRLKATGQPFTSNDVVRLVNAQSYANMKADMASTQAALRGPKDMTFGEFLGAAAGALATVAINQLISAAVGGVLGDLGLNLGEVSTTAANLAEAGSTVSDVSDILQNTYGMDAATADTIANTAFDVSGGAIDAAEVVQRSGVTPTEIADAYVTGTDPYAAVEQAASPEILAPNAGPVAPTVEPITGPIAPISESATGQVPVEIAPTPEPGPVTATPVSPTEVTPEVMQPNMGPVTPVTPPEDEFTRLMRESYEKGQQAAQTGGTQLAGAQGTTDVPVQSAPLERTIVRDGETILQMTNPNDPADIREYMVLQDDNGRPYYQDLQTSRTVDLNGETIPAEGAPTSRVKPNPFGAEPVEGGTAITTPTETVPVATGPVAPVTESVTGTTGPVAPPTEAVGTVPTETAGPAVPTEAAPSTTVTEAAGPVAPAAEVPTGTAPATSTVSIPTAAGEVTVPTNATDVEVANILGVTPAQIAAVGGAAVVISALSGGAAAAAPTAAAPTAAAPAPTEAIPTAAPTAAAPTAAAPAPIAAAPGAGPVAPAPAPVETATVATTPTTTTPAAPAPIEAAPVAGPVQPAPAPGATTPAGTIPTEVVTAPTTAAPPGTIPAEVIAAPVAAVPLVSGPGGAAPATTPTTTATAPASGPVAPGPTGTESVTTAPGPAATAPGTAPVTTAPVAPPAVTTPPPAVTPEPLPNPPPLPPPPPPVAPPQVPVSPAAPGLAPVTEIAVPPGPPPATPTPYDWLAPAAIGAAAGYGLTKLLTPEEMARKRGYGPIDYAKFGSFPDFPNPGLNPGWIRPTPQYQTTSPVQSQFYWGAHPYQLGPTFDPVAYNQVPGAPAQPFGLQQMYTPLDINTYLQGLNQFTTGPVAPRV